jgi:hypothetical protein
MNLANVMDEIAACLDQVAGLRVFAWPPGKIPAPPVAVVSYPTELDYQTTYGRGVNTIEIPVVLALGQPNDRQTRKVASTYLSGGGSGAVAALLDGYHWTTCSDVTAVKAQTDVVAIGGVEYLAALFTLQVIGQGAG